MALIRDICIAVISGGYLGTAIQSEIMDELIFQYNHELNEYFSEEDPEEKWNWEGHSDLCFHQQQLNKWVVYDSTCEKIFGQSLKEEDFINFTTNDQEGEEQQTTTLST